MKSIFIVFFFLIFFRITFAQTGKAETENRLKGKWDWVKTSWTFEGEGNSGSSIPASCLCTKSISFSFLYDRIEMYENDTLINESEYTVTENYYGSGPGSLSLHSNHLTGLVKFKGDTLGIGEFGGCGSVQFYVSHKAK